MILGGTPYSRRGARWRCSPDVIDTVTEQRGRAAAARRPHPPRQLGALQAASCSTRSLRLAGLSAARIVTEPEAAAVALRHRRRARRRRRASPSTTSAAARSTPPCCASAPVRASRSWASPRASSASAASTSTRPCCRHVAPRSAARSTELDCSDPATAIALPRLRQDCIAAKEALSADTEATIPVFLPDRHFDVRLTRSEFEEMIRALIESTIGALTRTLRSAGVEPTDLNAVLLVGGSSRIPLVAQMVTAALDRPSSSTHTPSTPSRSERPHSPPNSAPRAGARRQRRATHQPGRAGHVGGGNVETARLTDGFGSAGDGRLASSGDGARGAAAQPGRARRAACSGSAGDRPRQRPRRGARGRVGRGRGVAGDGAYFNDLGADSMVMARFCARLRKRDGVPAVSMKDVYRHPTVAGLAAAFAPHAPAVPDAEPLAAAVLSGVLADVIGADRVPLDGNFFDDLGADSMVMAPLPWRDCARETTSRRWIKDVYATRRRPSSQRRSPPRLPRRCW